MRLHQRIPTARWALRATIAAFGLLAGCGGLSPRPKEHATSALLDSGGATKVSSRQAADIQVALGRSEEAEGKPEEAEAAYLAALKQDPKRVDAEVRLAVLSDKKGDIEAADKHYTRALKLAPKDPEIHADRGYSYYLRRRWAEAESSLRRAIALSPKNARAHNNLGLVLARRGDSDGALAEFAKAGCDPADARANLGLAMALEGRLEEAGQEYRLALAAKPGSPQAREGLRASSVALAGRDDGRALAGSGGEVPKLDPGLARTSGLPPLPGDSGPGPR